MQPVKQVVNFVLKIFHLTEQENKLRFHGQAVKPDAVDKTLYSIELYMNNKDIKPGILVPP